MKKITIILLIFGISVLLLGGCSGTISNGPINKNSESNKIDNTKQTNKQSEKNIAQQPPAFPD